jgi:hypothetical protein
MRRTRNTSSKAQASTTIGGLRLCGSFEPAAKTKVPSGNRAPLLFSDHDARTATATLADPSGPDGSNSPGSPAERTVLVNLAPYLGAAGNHGSHQHAAGHQSHSDPLFAEISAVLDTMQDSIDSLKEDVDSYKFPATGSFSGPPRPAA